MSASAPPAAGSGSDSGSGAAGNENHCARCGRAGVPRLARSPLPGAAGREVQARVCADCWAEWTRAEVMVINELRLNFMDPASQPILDRQMREFLHLQPAAGAAPAGSTEAVQSSESAEPAESAK
jgi:Fe-S cluster biosynthesis and repair protein YggX